MASDPPLPDPHPWEMPFVWVEFLDRWFRALDDRDTGTLTRYSCVDVVSERVGLHRLQRSREGLIESLEPLWDSASFRHEWRLVLERGVDAVVEWERQDASRGPGVGGAVTEGLSFLRIREGTGMLDLLRTYENPPRP